MLVKQRLELVEEELDYSTPIVSEEDEIKDRGPCPPAPEYISYEAKLVWEEAAPDLWEKDRLHGGAISLLVNYCVSVGLAREMSAILEVDGKIIKGKPHPAYRMMLDAIAASRAIASELRFAREHMNNEEKAKNNGWGEGLLA